MQRRIRRSAIIVIMALTVEVISLLWTSPLSLILGQGLSVLLAAVGAGSFLLSLLSPEARNE